MRHRLVTATATAAALLALAALTGCSGSGSGRGVASGCTPTDTFSTISTGSLTVTTYSIPPYVTVKDATIGGIDGDILNAFATEECLTVKGVPVAPAAVIPAVQNNRSDVAAGAWWRSEARAKIVGLTEPVYLDQMAYISKDGYDTLSSLKGKAVGTVDGYLWVAQAKQYFGDALKVYKSTTDLYQDLKSGRIEAAMDSFGSGKFNAPDLRVKVAQPDPAITASSAPAQTTFPTSFDNPKLLKALDGFVTAIKKDGRLVKILEKNGLPASAATTGDPRLIGG